MAHSDWLPQHAAQLQRLRCAAGLDVNTLAKKHLMSASQLMQLENGGDSAFYSAQIKFNMGRKLVQSLGENLVVPDTEVQSVAPDMGTADRHQPQNPPAAKTAHYQIAPGTPLNQSRTKGWLWATLFAFFSLTAMALLLPSTNPPNVDVRAPVADTATPADSASGPVDQNQGAPQPAETHADLPANPAPSTMLAQPVATSQGPAAPQAVAQNPALAARPQACHWDLPAVDLTPDNDDPRTTYIHLVGLQYVALCWRDARGKSETIQLKPDETLTLTGQAPFSISSAHPDGFSLYFKGRRVRWPESGAAHFTLQAR